MQGMKGRSVGVLAKTRSIRRASPGRSESRSEVNEKGGTENRGSSGEKAWRLLQQEVIGCDRFEYSKKGKGISRERGVARSRASIWGGK